MPARAVWSRFSEADIHAAQRSYDVINMLFHFFRAYLAVFFQQLSNLWPINLDPNIARELHPPRE
jgi:hypothetical protein